MTAAPPVREPRPAWLLVLLLAGTLAGLGGCAVSLFALLFAPMAFDAGESTAAWMVFIGFLILPLIPLIGILVGWLAFALRAIKTALFGIVLMLVPAILAMVVLYG